MRIKIYTITKLQNIYINKNTATGTAGGGKLFATEISDAMRIRTGQRGEDAH